MDTNRLQQFCLIVRTKSLRKAAELWGISHSGLSKSMKALEADVGFPLFLPSGRGITISDEGMKLYQRTGPFFEELSRLLAPTEIQERTTIRLGSFEVFTTFFVGELLQNFLEKTPEIEIHELVPGKLEEALIQRRIDVGITYEPIPRNGIEYVKVTTLQMGAFVLKNSFKDKNILEIPFVVPVSPLEGTPTGAKGLDAWPEDKFKRTAPYRVDLLASGLELVRRGLCAIFIPSFLVDFHNKSVTAGSHLESVQLPKNFGSVRREVYIVTRESTPESKEIRQIAKALRQICGVN